MRPYTVHLYHCTKSGVLVVYLNDGEKLARGNREPALRVREGSKRRVLTLQ